MAGIVNGTVAACRRTTHCLRLLRLPYRPLDLCQSLATQYHRPRRHSTSGGPGNDSGKDHLPQLKPIQVDQGQGQDQTEQPGQGAGGLGVTAAPPDPQDVPGEKRTEKPHEVRPGLPLEVQPSRTPLEVKPQNPTTIICSSDSKADASTDTIESKAKSSNSDPSETPDAPTTEFIDDPKYQTPSPHKSELQSKKSTFLSIESELNSLTSIVNEIIEDPNNQDLAAVKSELTSQGSPPKAGVTQGQAESQDVQQSQVKAESKSQDWLQVEKKDESQAASQSLRVRTSSDSERSSDQFGAGRQGSNLRLPGEGQISGQETQADTLIYSSAKDGYGSQYGQMFDKEEKRSEAADAVKEDVVDSEIIDQWVDKFKRLYMAEKAAFGLDSQELEAPNSALKDEKPVTRNSDTPEPGRSTTTTKRSSPGQTMPLKIVARHKAPTEFKPTIRELSPSEYQSSKDAITDATSAFMKPLEFILQQPPTADSTKISEVIADNTSKSGDIPNIVREPTPGQSTEEIVAMFKEDCNGDPVTTEEGRVKEFFEAFDGLSRGQDPARTVLTSQSDDPVMSASGSGRTGDVTPSELGKVYPVPADSKLPKLEKSIIAKPDVNAPKNTDNSGSDLTIQGGNTATVDQNKDQVISKLSDKDDGVSEKSEKDKSFDQTSFDLAEKISSFIKSANDPDATKKAPTQKEKSPSDEAISILKKPDQKDKPKPGTTSMLPGDLYDPVSHEVSAPIPRETMLTEAEEGEDLNPGLEAPEVRSRKDGPKVSAPQGKDESKSKDEEKAPAAEPPPRKDKPQLDAGELSMKLLDKASSEMPGSVAGIPGSAAPSQMPAEKGLLQKLFDKILGRSGKGEGKRHMSTYTVRRQQSTSCMFPVPPILDHEVKREPKSDHGAPGNVSALALFAKDTKDLTEIKGGSPAYTSPKKTPRELLQEKQQSRNIKILGGSEECAKKMKRLKELTKDSDDDCDTQHFSHGLSHFLRQLRVSLGAFFYGDD